MTPCVCRIIKSFETRNAPVTPECKNRRRSRGASANQCLLLCQDSPNHYTHRTRKSSSTNNFPRRAIVETGLVGNYRISRGDRIRRNVRGLRHDNQSSTRLCRCPRLDDNSRCAGRQSDRYRHYGQPTTSIQGRQSRHCCASINCGRHRRLWRRGNPFLIAPIDGNQGRGREGSGGTVI